MRIQPRSIYAEHYVKGSHRVGRAPRVHRPWRPHVIAWAGPTACYRNRFYELDSWYKARIEKPERLPKMYVIDPDNHLLSMEERLSVSEPVRYNIGYKKRDFPGTLDKLNLPEEVLEVMSRKMNCKSLIFIQKFNSLIFMLAVSIDLRLVEHFQLSIFYHYRIFEDLFHANVFMYNTQLMRINWNGVGIYQGNSIEAADTANKPNVMIESLGDGFSTLIILNLDGNPYEQIGEPIHFMVCNIPDGKSVDSGQEIVPYLQALPFKGTGFHRLVALLLRHKQPIDASAYKPKSDHLSDRIFNVLELYKEYESICTPSAIAFSQVSWDVSVNETLHKLGMKAPIYKYEYNPPVKMEQKEFPEKPQPFDSYLDQYMDPKDVQADLLKKRLRLRTLEENPKQPKYPDFNYVENKKTLPNWIHEKLIKENSGFGRYEALWKNPID